MRSPLELRCRGAHRAARWSAPLRTHAARATISDADDNRAGPRIGAAYLNGGSVTAENEGVHVQPLMSLFGWQAEPAFSTGIAGAPLPVVESVWSRGNRTESATREHPLILGVRQPNGWEVGIGPTLTGAGTQFTFAAGVTRAVGLLNFPVNLAVTPGRRGASISLTTGFNRRTR